LRKEKQNHLTIALDLEGTLISNAVSQFPRPGLFAFLEYCYQNFVRLVIFTAVNEVRFRSIAKTVDEKYIAD
jgi:predicted HAD superfamily phosphohydrolase YqeG